MPFRPLMLVFVASVLMPLSAPEPPQSQRAGASAAVAPRSAVSLSMPGSGLDLSISYRQIGTDLRPFLEGSGLDQRGLHTLRVSALLAQGGMLVTDMELYVGETLLPPGRYPVGFTVGAGEAMNFFLVHGTEVIALGSDALKPGWSSDRLLLQLQYVTRNETRLIWHVGARAGRITLHPGGVERDRKVGEQAGAPDDAPDDEPEPGADDVPRR